MHVLDAIFYGVYYMIVMRRLMMMMMVMVDDAWGHAMSR